MLKKVYIKHHGCKMVPFTVDGKKYVVTHRSEFITSNRAILLVAAKQRFLGIIDPTDKEVKAWLYDPTNIPEIKNYLGVEEAKKFQWKDEGEDDMKASLVKHGYIDKTGSLEPFILMLEREGYNVTKKTPISKVTPTEVSVIEDKKVSDTIMPNETKVEKKATKTAKSETKESKK